MVLAFAFLDSICYWFYLRFGFGNSPLLGLYRHKRLFFNSGRPNVKIKVFFTFLLTPTKNLARHSLKTILSVAGFDPSSGAGVTADLAVFASFGAYGLSCISALTVQSTVGVFASYPVAAHILEETLNCLGQDLSLSAIKIGMLATADNVATMSAFLRRCRVQLRVPVVLDPVLRSSSSVELLDKQGIERMKEELLPLVDWVTPNYDELGILIGRSIRLQGEAEAGGRALQAMYPGLGVVATGGDLQVPNDLLLQPGGELHWLAGRKIESTSTHGTGCAFSSALACGLAFGRGGLDAAVTAKHFVERAILRAPGLGHGKGPMNLRWPLELQGTN